MLDLSIIRAMVASGCSAETLEAAILADHEKLLAKRSNDRARQRKHREKVKQNQQSCHSDVALHAVTDPSEKEVPQTPKENSSLTTSTSLRSVEDGKPSIRAELFGRGAQVLAEITGKPLSRCKPLIGQWLKLVEDEACTVLVAIDQAKEDFVADPVAWIVAKLGGRKSKPQKSRDQINAAIDRFFPSNASNPAGNRRALGPPTGSVVSLDFHRSDRPDDSRNGADIHPVSRKPIEGDMFSLDRDAVTF